MSRDWTLYREDIRGVVAHRYFGLDPAVVWSIVQTKIPALRSATERVLVETDGGKPGDGDAR